MTSAFKHNSVAPNAVKFSDPLAPAQFAETVFQMQRDARLIFGKDGCLQRPNAARFRSRDQGGHQVVADALSTSIGGDVNADLSDACVNFPAGHSTECSPAENLRSI